jgi:tetratricopeptide (TPR) repeat protein
VTAQAQYRKAADHLQMATAQRPMYGLAHLSLGQALRGLGKSEDAFAEFRRAVACQPALADAHLALGEALAAAGQTPEARRHLEQAQSLAPTDPRPPAALKRLREPDRK